jgi:hypothetical protein
MDDVRSSGVLDAVVAGNGFAVREQDETAGATGRVLSYAQVQMVVKDVVGTRGSGHRAPAGIKYRFLFHDRCPSN